MRTELALCDFLAAGPASWSGDWAWGLPLIVLTILFHVAGLAIINGRLVHRKKMRSVERQHPQSAFMVMVGATTLFATCLHGLEAGIWAFAYLSLGAMQDFRSAMLYSLNAITSYGHTELTLADRWRLLGALESLNGWLLFGLTTAFLFAVIGKTWSETR